MARAQCPSPVRCSATSSRPPSDRRTPRGPSPAAPRARPREPVPCHRPQGCSWCRRTTRHRGSAQPPTDERVARTARSRSAENRSRCRDLISSIRKPALLSTSLAPEATSLKYQDRKLGRTIPTVRVEPVARAMPSSDAEYSSSSAAARILARVSAPTPSMPRNALDTVPLFTPALRATSLIVTRRFFGGSSPRTTSSRRWTREEYRKRRSNGTTRFPIPATNLTRIEPLSTPSVVFAPKVRREVGQWGRALTS